MMIPSVVSLSDIFCRPSDKHQLNISEHTLNMIHRNLVALKEFLDRNSLVFHASPGDTASNLEALKVNERPFSHF